MIAKMIEIRDAMTFIPVLAVKLSPSNEADRYLLARQGFGTTEAEQREFILVTWLARGRSFYLPEEWNSRTLDVAHRYLQNHFDELESGAVVDVQFVLGEKTAPKESERIAHPLPPGL